MDASSVPTGRAETVETSQGGAVDASFVPAGRDESDSSSSANSGTDQGNIDVPPAEGATPDINGPDPGSEPMPARCRALVVGLGPLFFLRQGVMHLGRYRGCRRHALPGDMTRDKQSTVFGQHSYGVSGVARRRAQVKTHGCFRLGLVFPLHLAVARLEER